jgi:uncharacterized protein YyaL (SSP411 family)
MAMPEAVTWISDYDEALRRANAEDKPVLLDFYNPG